MNHLYRQIQTIFEDVQKNWARVNFDEKQFPEICFKALSHPTDYNFEEILEFTSFKHLLPVQSYPNDEFGEVPFTVFRHEKFFIDIYQWNIHNTSIHDHNFMGAFKLLHGQSKKVNFEFVVEEELAPQLARGELKSFGTEDLNVGDREIILPFEKYIHKITHFTNPSVTLLIRTNGYSKNLNLYNKKFAYQFQRSNASFQHKYNCIKMIYAYGGQDTTNELKALIEKLDTEGLYQLLLSYINTNPLQVSGENIARLYEDFKKLSIQGVLPEWFVEFLSFEIEAREKELRFQKMKFFGML